MAAYPKSIDRYDRYLACFSPAHCHLVPAPQGRPISMMDGDQPTAAISPRAEARVQSVAMYPVDGDFVIYAFRDYDEAHLFADCVSRYFPERGECPVVTAQPSRIGSIRNLVDLAYAVWYKRTNFPGDVLAKGFETSRPELARKLRLASERDRNLAERAADIAQTSTPMEHHILLAAKDLGYTL